MDDLPVYNKMDVAQANLRAAILSHFTHAHPAVIETLNGAANTVLRNLAEKKGISGAIHDSDFFEGANRKKWADVLHEPQNFHKHADKDADATLKHISLMTHMLIVESCQLYRNLSGDYEHFKDEVELQVFEIWFILKYPWLSDGDLTFITHHPFGNDLMALQVEDFPAWVQYIESRRPN